MKNVTVSLADEVRGGESLGMDGRIETVHAERGREMHYIVYIRRGAHGSSICE